MILTRFLSTKDAHPQAGLTVLCFALISFGFGLLSTAHAAIVELTVNGSTNAAIVNGEDVLLEWYVDAPVASCSINNGVGAIDVSSLPGTPAEGSMTVTPPEDTDTSYVLSCEGIMSAATIAIEPTVTLTLPGGSPRQIDTFTGQVEPHVQVDWHADNATRCSDVWRVPHTTGVIDVATAHWNDYGGKNTPDGWVRWDNAPHGPIEEDTTFYITCYNDGNGTEATASTTLHVTNPPPPAPPTVTITSPQAPSVTRDAVYGYAQVDVEYVSTDVDNCSLSAYYDNGDPYTSDLHGWNLGPTWRTSWDRRVRIATTTTFEAECYQPEVTIGTTTYPATSASDSVRIEVVDPAGLTYDSSGNWDRTSLPPVTVTATATPNPATINPLTGKADINLNLMASNADRCETEAYRIGETSPYWARSYSMSHYNLSISTTTRYEIYCYRQYDIDHGTPAEIANGTDTYELTVDVLQPATTAPPPQTYIYADPVIYDGNWMIASSTSRAGFIGSGNTLETGVAGTSSNSITFPFADPYGGSGSYDVHLLVCDENDGESTFRVYTEDDGLVGTYTTDDPDSPSNWCSGNAQVHAKIADDIALDDGDEITVECDTPDDGEGCRLKKLYFGAGDDGSVTLPPLDPALGFTTVDLLWLSENTTRCDALPAERADGSTYHWNGHHSTRVRTSELISTSTRFAVECYRGGDSLTDSSHVDVLVPSTATTYTATTLVGTGQCIDDGTFGSFGSTISAPSGYTADPGSGYCIPYLDLSAANPAVSLVNVSEDAINGTYDDLETLLIVRNHGTGTLPENSQISYKSVLTPDPAFALPAIESAIGYFNATLTAPADPAIPTESPTLTRELDDVPFGDHMLCSRVNLDGSPNFPEGNSTNNESCQTVALPVPRPPLSISADRSLIRRNETVEISWSAHTTYTLNCSVQGASGVSDTFDASHHYLNAMPGDDGPYTNTMTTGPLSSSAVFMLQCTEPITGTTFTEEARVEVVPDVEEI